MERLSRTIIGRGNATPLWTDIIDDGGIYELQATRRERISAILISLFCLGGVHGRIWILREHPGFFPVSPNLTIPPPEPLLDVVINSYTGLIHGQTLQLPLPEHGIEIPPRKSVFLVVSRWLGGGPGSRVRWQITVFRETLPEETDE